MRVLGVGDYNELGSIYLRLIEEGHEVRVYIHETGAHDVLAGLVERIDDWEAELAWARDGLIVFEEAGRGAQQDRLRREGYHVIGGSALGDRLEQDRTFGQACLRDAGLATAPVTRFHTFDEAHAFIATHPRRYVLKFDDTVLSSDANYVGMRDDGADVAALITRYRRQWRALGEAPPSFILMHHVQGVEIGVGCLFDGQRFVGPINLDCEHKRLCNGELGLEDGALVTTGLVGYAMVVTGRGRTIAAAQHAAYALAARIALPNVRYRTDIGDALQATGLATLTRLGWL